MENVAGRSDGVGTVEQPLAGARCRSHQAVGNRPVPRDAGVNASPEFGPIDLVTGRERFGVLAVVPPGLECADIGLDQDRRFLELPLHPLERFFYGAVVQPRTQAERKKVLAPNHGPVGKLEVGQLGGGQFGNRDFEQAYPRGEHLVLQRVPFESGLAEIGRIERVGIDNERATIAQLASMDRQRGRVHGNQNVRLVTRGEDLGAGEMQLKTADPGKGPRWCPNLGREVRQGGDVVTGKGRLVGELGAGQLHAVARIARKADYDAFDIFDRLLGRPANRDLVRLVHPRTLLPGSG